MDSFSVLVSKQSVRVATGFAAVMIESTPFLPGLSPVAGLPLTATFDAGLMSSDGGLIVLREIAQRLGLADMISRPLPDDRDPARIRHSYADMVLARIMAIAAGYEDCDDLDRLRTDPAFKLACGRRPETGHDLMSQPTLSRLENLADRRTLVEIGYGFINLFCDSYARTPDRIVLTSMTPTIPPTASSNWRCLTRTWARRASNRC